MKLKITALSVGAVTALAVCLLLPMRIHAQDKASVKAESRPDSAATPKQIPLRDFFKTPERSYFRLSPDGKFLSFMQPWGEGSAEKRKNIFIQTIDQSGKPTGEAKRLTSETARDIAGYSWKGGSNVLFVKDFGGDENFHVVSASVNGGVKDLTPFDGVRAEMIDDLLGDAEHILVAHNQRDKKIFDVYKLNVRSGTSELVAKNPGNITSWVTDHAGKVRAATTSDGVNTSLLYRATEKEEFKTVLTTNFRESAEPLFFTFDNKRMYVNSNRGRDKKAIVELDLATAKVLKLEDLYRFVAIPQGLNLQTQEPFELFSQFTLARATVLRKLISQEVKSFSDGLNVDCADVYQSEEVFQFITWYVSPDGLVVQPSFPHVAAACENDFLLPYAKLKPYLAPNSPLK